CFVFSTPSGFDKHNTIRTKGTEHGFPNYVLDHRYGFYFPWIQGDFRNIGRYPVNYISKVSAPCGNTGFISKSIKTTVLGGMGSRCAMVLSYLDSRNFSC